MIKRKPLIVNGKVYKWKKCECGDYYVGIPRDKDWCTRKCSEKYRMRRKRAKIKARKIKRRLILDANKSIKAKQKETA